MSHNPHLIRQNLGPSLLRNARLEKKNGGISGVLWHVCVYGFPGSDGWIG
jgi:hypothetical protein